MPGSLLPGTLGEPVEDGAATADEVGVPDHGQEPDVVIVFPTLLATMTFHPGIRLEAAIARGYARWLTEVYLPAHPKARAMLYLPIRDVEASCRLVNDFGAVPGVVGAFITNALFPPSLRNHHMRLYALLEERALPLAFHPVLLWTEGQLTAFDRYTAAYAYGHPFIQAAHLMNWFINGMPERFPRLACVFYGAGVAWLNFVAHRLDQGYMRRASEAPLLRERPSLYMRRYAYGTHPVEAADGEGYLEATFRLIGPRQFLYASNAPRWDRDTLERIRALTFLDPEEQRAILGGNAVRLFKLSPDRGGA